MNRRRLLLAAGLGLALPAAAAPPSPRAARVAIETAAGRIVVAVDLARAPITAGNFLRYVDAGKFDGTYFYRAARSRTRPGVGLIQGGIDQDIRASFMPIRHEPTNLTGLRHVDGTLSMARNKPGTAMGDFFICAGAAPSLDAAPGYPGYAAFGRVLQGMDVVHRILGKPTYPGGYSVSMMGQSIVDRVKIVRVRRIG